MRSLGSALKKRGTSIDKSNQRPISFFRIMASVARREKSAHQETPCDQEPMTAINRGLVRGALLVLLWAPMSASGQDISEPEGYRTEDYRAPTPTTLKGARVVTTAEAEQIWKSGGAIFLDVLPYAPR